MCARCIHVGATPVCFKPEWIKFLGNAVLIYFLCLHFAAHVVQFMGWCDVF